MISRLLPTLILAACPAMRLQAPTHVLVDWRPRDRAAIIRTVARVENCVTRNNPGCISKRGRVLRYKTLQVGARELERYFDRRGCVPVREILKRYNPARPDYAEIILGMAGVPGDSILGRCE